MQHHWWKRILQMNPDIHHSSHWRVAWRNLLSAVRTGPDRFCYISAGAIRIRPLLQTPNNYHNSLDSSHLSPKSKRQLSSQPQKPLEQLHRWFGAWPQRSGIGCFDLYWFLVSLDHLVVLGQDLHRDWCRVILVLVDLDRWFLLLRLVANSLFKLC